MKIFTGKIVAAAFALAAVGTVNADDSTAWDFEEIQNGGEYYIYNIGEDKFMNDDNTLVKEGATTWIVTGTNGNRVIKSKTGGKYISITSTVTGDHNGSGLEVGVYKYNDYAFSAVANSTSESSLSAVENKSTFYLIGNSVEDYRKIRRIDKKVMDTQYHVHYMIVSGSSFSANETSVGSDAGRWLFISTTQYELKAKRILLNEAMAALQAKIDEVESYLNGLNVPEAALSSLNSALTAAKEAKSNETATDENIEAVKNATTNLNTVYESTVALVADLSALKSAIDTAQGIVNDASLTEASRADIAAELPTAQNLYNTAKIADDQAVKNETSKVNNLIGSTQTLVSSINALTTTITNLETLEVPAAVISSMKETIDQARSLIENAGTANNDAVVAMKATIENLYNQAIALKPYYMQGRYSLEHCSKLLSDEALTEASEALEACTSKTAMLDVILSMKSQAIEYLNNIDGWYWWGESLDVSAVLLNASFEMNDLTGWHAYRKPTIGSAQTDFSSDTAVKSISGSVENGHGEYHLVCGSESSLATSGGHMVYQIISGLPVGSYTAEGVVTDINTTVAGHRAFFTSIVAPVSMFGGASGSPKKVRTFSDDEILSRITDVMNSNNSSINPVSITESSGTSMHSASVDFKINNPGDVVLLGYSAGNAGQNQFSGNYPYRADNMTLKMTANVWTGIEEINDTQDAEAEGDGYFYDMQGRRVNNPERGIYIHNGKKVVK